MTFKKILCPIDFSPGSDRAMRVAVRLAERSSAELVIAHAFHIPPLVFAGEAPFPADMIERMQEDAQRSLAAAAKEATRLGAQRLTSRLLTGLPWDQIVEAVRSDATVDLVVMGTQGRTGLSRVFLGSVAEKVVRLAPCSVLTVREQAGVTPFDHVLCPIDFSESSRHALELAAKLAEPGGAGITLLHVLELPVDYSGDPHVPGFIEGLDTKAAHLLEQWGDDVRAKVSVPVTIRSTIGSPGGQALAALDDDRTFDLVVMGSHRRTGIRRVLLGSVAEKVVRHSACPVLIARDRAATDS